MTNITKFRVPLVYWASGIEAVELISQQHLLRIWAYNDAKIAVGMPEYRRVIGKSDMRNLNMKKLKFSKLLNWPVIREIQRYFATICTFFFTFMMPMMYSNAQNIRLQFMKLRSQAGVKVAIKMLKYQRMIGVYE